VQGAWLVVESFSLNEIQQPARDRVMCTRVSMFSCVQISSRARRKAKTRATLGIPFKNEGSWHVLVLSTKFIAGRRVSWILVEMLIMVHEIHEWIEIFERGLDSNMVDKCSECDFRAWRSEIPSKFGYIYQLKCITVMKKCGSLINVEIISEKP
jgi:hypothetical protein